MSLSKPCWTNWESFGNEAGVAFVSTQEGATCVRHALGKGIFEHLEKTGCYDGCTEDVLELMQTRIIELVEAIFPDKNPIDPYKFDGDGGEEDCENEDDPRVEKQQQRGLC